MVRKKITLHSIGNQDDFNYYIFDKKQIVVDVLSKIFVIDFDVNWNEEIYNKKINRKTDLHEDISDIYDKIRIDLFYGKSKMYLTLICSESLRLKFNEALFKYATMLKYKFRKNVRKNKNKEETIGPFRHKKLK